MTSKARPTWASGISPPNNGRRSLWLTWRWALRVDDRNARHWTNIRGHRHITSRPGLQVDVGRFPHHTVLIPLFGPNTLVDALQNEVAAAERFYAASMQNSSWSQNPINSTADHSLGTHAAPVEASSGEQMANRESFGIVLELALSWRK